MNEFIVWSDDLNDELTEGLAGKGVNIATGEVTDVNRDVNVNQQTLDIGCE